MGGDHPQTGEGAGQPPEQRLPSRAAIPPGSDHQHHPVGIGPGVDQADEAFEQDRRLAGARTADDEQRAVVVFDGTPLEGIEREGGHAHARMLLRG